MTNIKLTIVTPTRNQVDTISQTLQSVLDQNMRENLEYIVVDACSADGTSEKIEEYAALFKKQGCRFVYIREKDRGQSDAINKGWSLGTGQIFGYVNSDDFYTANALQKVQETFSNHPESFWAYGGWQLVNKYGQVYLKKQPKYFSRASLLNYCDIGQPSCFFQGSILKAVGMLREDYHLAMDYDLWLRIASRGDPVIIPEILSNMRYHESAKSASFAIQQATEVYKISSEYTAPLSYRRFMQTFYWLRALTVTAFGFDVSRRIARMKPAN